MTQIITQQPAWSYSKLSSYEVCPRRYYETQIKKAWPEEPSEHLNWGNEVHAAMAIALKTGSPLPITFASYQPWIDKVNRTNGELLVECKWALTRDLVPTAWFSKQTWVRTIADAVKVDDMVGLVVDWKTGKSANADPVQLVLTSLVAFAHFPKLRKVRSDFVWLQEDTNTTQVLNRNEIADAWAEIMPRVDKLQQATIDENFPPMPNRFCRSWCPVKSCEYHGTAQ